jgi:hypothetical protein
VRIRSRLRTGILAAALLPLPASAAEPVVVESRQAFLVEQLLRIARLEGGDEANSEVGTTSARIGAPLVAVKKNLHEASLALARGDLGRFDQLRGEVAAQMDMVDALLSQAEVEVALARAEAQLAQTALIMGEAERRARAAEARLRTGAPGSAPPVAPP